MENCGKHEGLVGTEYTSSWKACSACAGDYEDPDRTAPPDESEGPDEDEGRDAGDDEDFLDGETKQQVTTPQE